MGLRLRDRAFYILSGSRGVETVSGNGVETTVFPHLKLQRQPSSVDLHTEKSKLRFWGNPTQILGQLYPETKGKENIFRAHFEPCCSKTHFVAS